MRHNNKTVSDLSFKAGQIVLALFGASLLAGCSLTEFVTGKTEPQTNSTSAQAEPTQAEATNSDTQSQEVKAVYTGTSSTSTSAADSQKPASEPSQRTSVVANSPRKSARPVVSNSPTKSPKTVVTKRPIAQVRQIQPAPQPYYQADSGQSMAPSMAQHSLSGAQHSVLVEEYIERMATDLINNLASVNNSNKPVIGVTSFVDFNNNLKSVTPFGNRVAEHFINELQRSGFLVADYKVRDTISIANNGDLVFSRNTNELNAESTMTHVLAGNIMYQEKGLKIIARVVDFDNKWVIASSSVFMPYFVLDTIVPSGAKHSVY